MGKFTKYPDKIRVTPKVSYEVLFVEKIGDDDTLGRCDGDAKQILIRMGMGERATVATLIHEVLHAVEFEYGTPIPHSVISAIDAPIEKVLRLNGWLSYD